MITSFGLASAHEAAPDFIGDPYFVAAVNVVHHFRQNQNQDAYAYILRILSDPKATTEEINTFLRIVTRFLQDESQATAQQVRNTLFALTTQLKDRRLLQTYPVYFSRLTLALQQITQAIANRSDVSAISEQLRRDAPFVNEVIAEARNARQQAGGYSKMAGFKNLTAGLGKNIGAFFRDVRERVENVKEALKICGATALVAASTPIEAGTAATAAAFGSAAVFGMAAGATVYFSGLGKFVGFDWLGEHAGDNVYSLAH